MRKLLVFLILLAGPAFAECRGSNLLDQMDAAEVAALEQRAALQPYHQGNLWQATKGESKVTLVGTYHLDDPRHDVIQQRVRPLLENATALLVEAGPDEEAALKAQAAQDPGLFIMADATLPDLMNPAEWTTLSAAMQRRGVPGFMAAKFQPWYIAVMLAIPPCMMDRMSPPNGLDHRLMAEAKALGLPIRGLEPHDTVFKLFDGFTRADQVAMLRSSLAIEGQAEDYTATLADAYFDGDSRLIWELMRHLSLGLPGYDEAQIEADLARLEQALVIRRNESWIAVIEAAAENGPVVAAFGALHLPGQHGIPALLEARGWTLQPLTP